MTRRVEIFRPHPDNPDAFTRTVTDDVSELPRVPGAFALCIKTSHDDFGPCEELEERWRVDEQGRVFRAVYMSHDLEHEPRPCLLAACALAGRGHHWEIAHEGR